MEDRRELLLELGGLIRRLRKDARLTGKELAHRAGVAQPTISKIETGRMLPSPETVTQVSEALRLGDDERRRLARVLARVQQEVANLGTGLAGRERALGVRAAAASLLRSFQPTVVPDLLQTAEYARHALTAVRPADDEDLARAVAARVERQSVLYEPRHEFHFVLAESALRAGPPGAMVSQLHRLATLASLDHVRLGVLPWDARVPAVPLHGFTLYDSSAVLLETFTGDATLTAEDEVRAYGEVFTAFAAAARYGDEARPLLDRIDHHHRALLGR
ncbi:helix-turn-helix domain-containing protein [Bailinhaonella thermotolerans]|uniref:XRE family transcriptional regulator n=1 Tax=Bailinhaonella thermotolerans TaxID=1070861 RepID=A0A3A4AW50_9ACTN|nr:helix-turn-helix transcriptional regulator [Bailinhaonella thermotolerans]RJL33093.1 XRE family transcriptional regulator [Bailinhaonella thermotolerans]